MNKTSISALVVAVIAVAVAGFAFFSPAQQKLGSYVPPVQSAGGFVATYATSTSYTLGCTPQNVDWAGITTNATGTLSAATSTFLACPQLNNLGTSVNGLIVNDSVTSTVAYVGGTGVTFKCETNGAGTSTLGLGSICNSTGFTISTSSALQYVAYFDGASTTFDIGVGNNFH